MSTSTGELRLRSATAEDEVFLIALTRRLGEVLLPPWRSPAEVAASDHELLREAVRSAAPDTLIRIVEDVRGNRLGYTLVTTKVDYFTREPHAYVENLVLVPEAEGRGIARILMADAEAWARSRGFRRVALNVFVTNQKAIGLYQHLGYRPELVRYLKEL